MNAYRALCIDEIRQMHPGFPEGDIPLCTRIPETCQLAQWLKDQGFRWNVDALSVWFTWHYPMCRFIQVQWDQDAHSWPVKTYMMGYRLLIGDDPPMRPGPGAEPFPENCFSFEELWVLGAFDHPDCLRLAC